MKNEAFQLLHSRGIEFGNEKEAKPFGGDGRTIEKIGVSFSCQSKLIT